MVRLDLELARGNFPEAIQILDFWHASEHVAELARLLDPAQGQSSLSLFTRWREYLGASALATLLREARAELAAQAPAPQIIEAVEKQLAYLEKNRQRMDYARFRALGLFIGSGVVEAGCKTVVGKRLKQSGMFWSLPGARNVLDIRCALKSQDRFDAFWRSRAAA